MLAILLCVKNYINKQLPKFNTQNWSQVKTKSVKLFCNIIKPSSGEQYSASKLTESPFWPMYARKVTVTWEYW